MAYEEKTIGETDRTVALVNPGDRIEGYFLGTKSTPNKLYPGKTSKLHRFKMKDGSITGVWGKTYLDQLLTPELMNLMCLVEFIGMIPSKERGKRPGYGYKVRFDRDKTLAKSNQKTTTKPIEVEQPAEEVGDPSFEVERF